MRFDYLIDTSAMIRILRGHDVDLDAPLLAGLIGYCPITELELLRSATSADDRRKLIEAVDSLLVWTPMGDRTFERAREVQAELTRVGKHRCAAPVDLLVAATAELAGVTVLHYDRDFETIAEVTGQPTAWIAPPGSLN